MDWLLSTILTVMLAGVDPRFIVGVGAYHRQTGFFCSFLTMMDQENNWEEKVPFAIPSISQRAQHISISA